MCSVQAVINSTCDVPSEDTDQQAGSADVLSIADQCTVKEIVDTMADDVEDIVSLGDVEEASTE